jgi:hypothetical protein
MSVNSTVASTRSTSTGNEFLDIAEKLLDITGPEDVIVARVFDELRIRDLAGERAAGLDRHLQVARAMQNEGWNPDTGKDRANIDFCVQQRDRLDGAGTGGKPFDFRQHLDPLRFGDKARPRRLEPPTGAPGLETFIDLRFEIAGRRRE